MISEIPTMAIDTVYIHNNTSLMQDEVLCHRLGLIPIRADADQFEASPFTSYDGKERDVADHTEANSIKFTLRVKCPSRKQLIQQSGDPKVEYLTVFSKSLQLDRASTTEDVGLVHDDIILAKLAPGEVCLARVWRGVDGEEGEVVSS